MPKRTFHVALFTVLILASIGACKPSPTNDQTIDGWEVSTVRPGAFEVESISIGKNGEAIVSVWDTDGRRVFLSEKGVGVTVDIRDVDMDGRFDYLHYRGRKYQIYDNDFDGEIDVIGTISDGSLQLRHLGEWHDVQRAAGEMYIEHDGKRLKIILTEENGLVPINVE